MALTPQVRVSQGGVSAVGEGEPDVRVSQAGVLAVGIIPTEFVEVSQAGVQTVTFAETDVQVSQAGVMVIGRGRVADPNLRAWVYWLDNHWFYVLRLPTGWTLVYDLTTEQWSIYGSGTSTTWRPFHGINWLGSGALMSTYGSNVLCGDDGNGALYFLNPLSPTDDNAILGAEDPQPFLRRITGQVTTRSHNYIRCYGVELMGSIGDGETADVTLYTSDDIGHTYTSQGTVTLTALDYSAWAQWNTGLGSFSAPGRLFRIDDEYLQRIDWLDMREDG